MTEVYHIFGYIFATYSLETSIIWNPPVLQVTSTHPLASTNQFLPDDQAFRGCGLISVRLARSLQLEIT